MAVDFEKIGGAVGDIFGAVGGLKDAKGLKSQAQGYERAAAISDLNKEIAGQASAIQMVQSDRDIYKALGSQAAAIGGANLAASGSALDIMRDSARQGSLTKQLLGRQSQIEQLAYEQEADSYKQMAAASTSAASSAKKSATGKIIGTALDVGLSFIPGGGIVKGIGKALKGIFSDDALKEDINLLYRRADGIGLYSFRYKGQPTTFKGVLASEVQQVYPHAVSVVDGSLAVDYDVIGVTPEVL